MIIGWKFRPGRSFMAMAGNAGRSRPPDRIARYPVTVAQYQAFVDAGGYRERRWWPDEKAWDFAQKTMGPEDYRELFQTPNHPRVGVSWWEADAFCRWLSATTGRQFALPAEEQWERAARGREGRKFPWGRRLD